MLISRLSRVIRQRVNKGFTLGRRAASSVELPKHADIVVIGGGSIGCSTLYHLSKLGANAILLERDKLSSGTTWHSAGGVWRMWAYDVDVELADRTYKLASDILPNHYGFSAGWEEGPGLFLSKYKMRHDEYQRIVGMSKMYGAEAREVRVSELKSIFPLLNTDGIYGAILAEGSGHVEPTSWCVALSRAAGTHGAKTFEDSPVTEILTKDEPAFGYKRVCGVRVNDKVVECNAVALCTGAWAPKMGEKLGVDIPTMAIKHAYVYTDAIPEFKNKPKIRDHDISVYLATRHSGAMQIGGYELNPLFWEDVNDDFVFGLFDSHWDNFAVHFENACKRLPIVRETGIQSIIRGPMSFTPDHRPCMGEAPGIRGLFMGCGMDLGIMMGGGYGQELAAWLYYGRPSKHMFRFDIARFSTAIAKNKSWLKERVHECHATMYKAKTPHDEPLSGRNLFMSPIHDKLLEAGAIFDERMGYERPAWFAKDGNTSPVLEYDWLGAYEGTQKHQDYMYRQRIDQEATFDWPKHTKEIFDEMWECKNNVAMCDLSSTGKILLTGPEARRAASWIFSNFKGDTCAALALHETGKIEADAVLIKPEPINCAKAPFFDESSDVYLTTGSHLTERMLQLIRHACLDQGFDVDVRDITRDIAMLSVNGPASASLLASLLENEPTKAELPSSSVFAASIEGVACLIMKHAFLGVPGFDIHLHNESCLAVYDKLMTKGVRHVGYRALDLMAVAEGCHSFDGALRGTDYPFEISDGDAALFDCTSNRNFIGRTALLKAIKSYRKEKRLVRVTVDENVPLWGSEILYCENNPVGFTRSTGYCINQKKSVSYAMVTHKGGVTDEWLRLVVRLDATHHSPWERGVSRANGVNCLIYGARTDKVLVLSHVSASVRPSVHHRISLAAWPIWSGR